MPTPPAHHFLRRSAGQRRAGRQTQREGRLPRTVSVAGAGASVGEAGTGTGQERPVVAVGPKGELEDPEGSVVAGLAVGQRCLEGLVVAAAGADDELADPPDRVRLAAGVLGGEPLVEVVVTVERQV